MIFAHEKVDGAAKSEPANIAIDPANGVTSAPLAMISKQQLASMTEVLATTSVIGVGWALGGTVGAGIMAGIGINLGSDIIQKGGIYLKEKWLSAEYGVLNHDIQRALARGLVKALSRLEQRYFERAEVKSETREKNDAIRGLFQELRDVAPTVLAASVEKVASDAELKQYLYGEIQEARKQLWERIEGTKLIYTYYGEQFKNFLRDHINEELVFCFGEELKTDNYECNKAWRAFQRMLLEGIQADVRAVQSHQERIHADLQLLAGIETRLDQLVNEVEKRTANEPFERGFDEGLRNLKQVLENVAATTRRTERKIDELAADVKTLLITDHRIQTDRAFQYQLPAPPSDFTGREKELSELRALVRSGNVTISGLHGMGGIGKTALALMLASELKEAFPDGQIYLDLKGVSQRNEAGSKQIPLSSADVMTHVIRSWYPEETLPDCETELSARYRTVLANKRALLFFDNARNAAQLTPLIPGNCQCLILVTSRQRFSLGGREPYDIDKLKPEDAVRLLRVNCSRLNDQEANDIAKICDYLPMALKPAVGLLSKSRGLSAQSLLKKLTDKKERLNLKDAERKDELVDISIEASFQLSYELLADDDIEALQQHWRRLAVFPDTFDEAAAASLWQVDEDRATECLNALDSYSLIEVQSIGETKSLRYSLHDLARDFADTRLGSVERDSCRQLHASYFASVLKGINDIYRDNHKDQAYSALESFDTEWINIEAGWNWAAGSASAAALRLLSDFSDAGTSILFLRQRSGERIKWLESAVDASRKLNLRGAEGRHLCNLGRTYHNYSTDKHEVSIGYLQASLAIARELNAIYDEGQALGSLGVVYRDHRKLETAKNLFDKRLEIARNTSDRHGEASTHGNVGLLLLWQKDYEGALQHFEEQLRMARDLKKKHLECQALGNSGQVLACLGRIAEAIDLLNESVRLARRIGARRAEAGALGQLGNVMFNNLQNYELAKALYEQSLQITREVEFGRAEKGALVNLAKVCLDLGKKGSASDCRLAIKYCEEILPIARKSKDKLSEGLTLWKMAQGFHELQNDKSACDTGRRAYHILSSIKHKGRFKVKEAIEKWCR